MAKFAGRQRHVPQNSAGTHRKQTAGRDAGRARRARIVELQSNGKDSRIHRMTRIRADTDKEASEWSETDTVWTHSGPRQPSPLAFACIGHIRVIRHIRSSFRPSRWKRSQSINIPPGLERSVGAPSNKRIVSKEFRRLVGNRSRRDRSLSGAPIRAASARALPRSRSRL